MITVKIPIKIDFDVTSLQRQQSIVVKYSYNRFKEGKKEKEIRELINNLKNIDKLDSWLIQSGIKDGESIFKRFKDQIVIFGGKNNLISYLKGNKTKESYKLNKLLPLTIQGEALQKGNRKFELDIISNNQIIFKLSRNQHFTIKLPKLRPNYRRKLSILEENSKSRLQPYSIKLTNDHICISFEEAKESIGNIINTRSLSIDLNPNRIGFSICQNDKIIHCGIVEYKDLNLKSNLPSSSVSSKYLSNKRSHELHELVKYVSKLARHYQCQKIIIEKLTIKNKNHSKGKNFNRLVNNSWNRSLIINGLKKYCKSFGISIKEVNPAYSSIIGNVIFKQFPDPVSASLELNRREQSGIFYPKVPNVNYLNELWKQTLDKNFESWIEVAEWLKNSKMRYRIPLDESSKCFRLKSHNSNIDLYEL